MNSMINMFLENARQAVVRGKMTMTGIIDFDPSNTTATATFIPNYTNNNGGANIEIRTPDSGFSIGKGFPTAWD